MPAIYNLRCNAKTKIHDKSCKVTIRTDHKPLLEIVAGTAKAENTAAADKFRHWTSDILPGDPHLTIEYKKGSLNLIADSLSRLRTGDNCEHNMPLQNTEPLILKKKDEVNMVTTCAKSVEQGKLIPSLLDLQIKVRDIFKTSDKCQLILNAEKVFDSLDPAKLRELQDRDQSIINLKNSRKQSVIANKEKHTQDGSRSQRQNVASNPVTQGPQTMDHHIYTRILWTLRQRSLLLQNKSNILLEQYEK